jgi:hypothetical protein
VLAARAHETQVMEVDAAIRAAAASLKAGRAGEVIRPLEAALVGEPSGVRGATIHYYLGVAYARTDLAKAATHLQAAVAGDSEQEDARFQLASVLDRSGALAEARAEYDRFATAHPQSPLAVFALRRSATLARMPGRMPPGMASGDPSAKLPVGVRAWPKPRPAPDPAGSKAAPPTLPAAPASAGSQPVPAAEPPSDR